MTAAINSNDDFDDELLSAYVDDELTVEERALVEERLRVDPHAAQLVEELRILSSAIKSLPRETLGRDLRASIQAEAFQAKADSDAQHVLPMADHDRVRGFRRGLIWSAITIAAALLLMFVQSNEPERDVAAVADREEPPERRNREREFLAEDAPRPQGEMRAWDAPRDASETLAANGVAPAAPTSAAAPLADGAKDVSRKEDLGDIRYLEEQLKLESGERSEPGASEIGALGGEGAAQGDSFAYGTPAGAPALVASEVDKLTAAASSSVVAPATVELEVKAPDAVEHFVRILDRLEFDVEPELAATAPADQKLRLDGEASGEITELYARTNEPSAPAAGDGARAEVLVEGSPAQIDQLVLSCQADTKTFAAVNLPESLARLDSKGKLAAAKSAEAPPAEAARLLASAGAGGAASATGETDRAAADESKQLGDREDAAAFGGGQVASGPALGRKPSIETKKATESESAQTAATDDDNGGDVITRGRAWRLTPQRSGGVGGAVMLGVEAIEQQVQQSVQAGAPVATAAPPPISTRSSLATPQSESLAKAPQQTPKAGWVRVLFVLRPSPTPAAQPITPAAQPADAKQ